MNRAASVVAAGNQRWRQHRASYRPAREPIDPRRYCVDLVAESDAKRFVCNHHSYGTDRLNHPNEESRDELVHHAPGLDRRQWVSCLGGGARPSVRDDVGGDSR